MNIVTWSRQSFDYSIEYYISGPMTGLPEYNYPAFEAAKSILSGEGIRVRSPHDIDFGGDDSTCSPERGTLPYFIYMKAGYKLLLECGGIIMLPGWTKSNGARDELYVARSLGYPAFAMGEGVLVEIESDEH